MKRFKKWKEEHYNKAAASVSASLDWFEKDIISYHEAMKWADDEIRDYTQKELSYIRELTPRVMAGEATISSSLLKKRQKKNCRYIFWMKFYKKFLTVLRVVTNGVFHVYMIPKFVKLDLLSMF